MSQASALLIATCSVLVDRINHRRIVLTVRRLARLKPLRERLYHDISDSAALLNSCNLDSFEKFLAAKVDGNPGTLLSQRLLPHTAAIAIVMPV